MRPEEISEKIDEEFAHEDEDTMKLPSGDEMAAMIAEDVNTLLTDSRDSHGDAVENQQHIAEGWTWYLRGCGLIDEDSQINGSDVGRMMTMVKMSRAAVGEEDIDHDRDIAGYGSISGACQVSRGASDFEDLQEYVDNE